MMLKKIWHFLWKEDSLASWLVNVVLAFVIIKFLVYPGLGLALGTPYPIVAVVSESMDHSFTKTEADLWKLCNTTTTQKEGTYWEHCGYWYENKDISEAQFQEFPLKNGFNKGDLIILQSKEHIEVGDIIVYWASWNPRPEPIIHRVVEEREGSFVTKGDHNRDADPFLVQEEQTIGKALWRIPLLGWVKIIFVEIITLGGA